MKRIVQLLPYDIRQVGGIERHVRMLAIALHHLEHNDLKVIVAHRRRGHSWSMIDVASWDCGAHEDQTSTCGPNCVSHEEPFRLWEGDVLHIHGLARLGFARLIRTIPTSVPIVLSTHGSYWSELEGVAGVRSMMRVGLDGVLTAPFLRRCAMILVASDAERSIMEGLLRRDLICTPLRVQPLPTAEVLLDSWSTVSRVNSGRLLAVGRQDRIKGFELLTETILSNRDLPGCDIVGPAGNATRALRRLSTQGSSRVRLLPAVHDRSEMRRLFQQAKAVVVPSYFESFSLVAHEAIALDVPVIISEQACAAIPRSAVQTFPVGDSVSLAEQIRRLAIVGQSPATRQARAYFRANMIEPEVYALKLMEIYRAVLRAAGDP